jgi:hypothetical protein
MAEQATDNRVPVSRRALILRINRKLPGHELKTNRAPGNAHRELGRYFIVDEYNNSITCQFVDLSGIDAGTSPDILFPRCKARNPIRSLGMI